MSFSRQAPRERAVRAQVAAPVRSASHDKEAALTDAERFFSAPRFSVSDEAEGSESRTPLASTDGNRMATKPAGASLASGKRLASPQQASNAARIAAFWSARFAADVWFLGTNESNHSLPSAPRSPQRLQPHTPTRNVLFFVLSPALRLSMLEMYSTSSVPADS